MCTLTPRVKRPFTITLQPLSNRSICYLATRTRTCTHDCTCGIFLNLFFLVTCSMLTLDAKKNRNFFVENQQKNSKSAFVHITCVQTIRMIRIQTLTQILTPVMRTHHHAARKQRQLQPSTKREERRKRNINFTLT